MVSKSPVDVYTIYPILLKTVNFFEGRKLQVGTKMERGNQFCESGFADVHMDFIMGELNGTLAPEADIPESEVAGDCNRNVGGGTRERMVDFMYDYFTTEDYLIDSLSLFGPTTTTMLVTPLMQHFGGGLFYKPEDCTDYLLEDVPEVCQVFKAGRLAYTCLKVFYFTQLPITKMTVLSRSGKPIAPSFFRTIVTSISMGLPWRKRKSTVTLSRQ